MPLLITGSLRMKVTKHTFTRFSFPERAASPVARRVTVPAEPPELKGLSRGTALAVRRASVG